MGTAADYRMKADENEALARLMSREDHRRHFMEVALELRSIAEAMEARESVDADT